MSLARRWKAAADQAGQINDRSTNLLKVAMKSTEHNEQATFFDGVLYQYRNRDDFIRPLFFAVPNGAWLGGKSYAMMNKLKREGLTTGVADILYLQPRGGYSYLAIEMKAEYRQHEKDGGVTPEQLEFLRLAREAGAWAEVLYGADTALAVFANYMELPVIAGGIVGTIETIPSDTSQVQS